ncbi:kinase-like protein, partial [Schizopora paradoxa]
NFARELRILSRIRHPNVLNFLGYALWENHHYYIASEWMERGDLKSCISIGLTMLELFEMSTGIAKGLCYLHEKDIVHGDMKSLNVLVSSSGEPVVADFGLARMAESLWSKGYYSTVTVRASLRWVPHEFYFVDDNQTFRPNQKTDVWSFGMTLLVSLNFKLKDLVLISPRSGTSYSRRPVCTHKK